MEVVFVSNVSVEVILLPKLPASVEQKISFFCRVGLPATNNLREAEIADWSEERMNVVGHHNPSVEAIPLGIEVKQSLLHHCGNLWTSEMAGAATRIKVHLDQAVQLGFTFSFGAREQFVLPTRHHMRGH